MAVAWEGPSGDGFISAVGVTLLLAGYDWIEGTNRHYIDANGVERTIEGIEEGSLDEAQVLGMIGL